MSECPFCERRDNCDFEQLYAGVVMRFEPLNPVMPGHMLFMPTDHAEHPHPDALATAMRYAGKYAAERGGDYNLITSSGPAATQTVPHMHIHYVPRRQGDGLRLPWTLAAEKQIEARADQDEGGGTCPMCGAQPGARCLSKNGKKRGRPHSARTNPTPKESTMPTSQAVVVTDRDRTPDERVKVHPFRHPWIKGADTDPECGRTWHDHGWIDRGDHGFTVCPTEAERPEVTPIRALADDEVAVKRGVLDMVMERLEYARLDAIEDGRTATATALQNSIAALEADR